MVLRLVFFSLLFTIFACGNNIPFDEESILKRPVGIQVTALTGKIFRLSYSVQNQERTFDGYNVYISKQPISDGEARSMKPLLLDGSQPTLKHDNSQFNISTVLTTDLNRFNDTQQFESGIRFYFRIAAHSRKNYQSEPSNEVFADTID